ncbi:MAG TPA: peptide ABC transporter substrate-binding protein [Pyrinomonadaceae bacterium]|nr:peptide ABC transporter substrate-binding protein [Pyrinomonadaceae bacterium]
MRTSCFLRAGYKGRILIAGFILLSLLIAEAGCFLRTESSPFYGRVVVPQAQEFRWSDGGLPQIFDPAFAAAPPDTDAVRALFEGLTDYDPQTLKPVPAVAMRWESSDDHRVWTFYLRDDALWSTGAPVTAQDFVRSWQRTLKLGDLAPHTDLLSNIVGAKPALASAPVVTPTTTSSSRKFESRDRPAQEHKGNMAGHTQPFGAEALNDHLLRVHLQRPNPNFPALVAHPVFRPVKVAEEEAKKKIAAADLVSNGAFLLGKSASDSVLLERAEKYWGRSDVNLERVKFVGTRDPETALAAYHAGEIDALTNAPFEPLALKLLAPYTDYHRNTYGALTYYSFNTAHRPFEDVRVREALAIAIDRERISREEMGGATEPAHQFLPNAIAERPDEAVVARSATLDKDLIRARALLAEAGYPNGRGFPPLRLLINRNDQQRQVAEAVAAMWRANLNVVTEIVLKTWDDYEAAIRAGEYDLARRGMVMQTTDESTNISMLFPPESRNPSTPAGVSPIESPAIGTGREPKSSAAAIREQSQERKLLVDSEAEALRQISAIPIYFACSSTLVKPYVSGFDTNVLDAPSLKKVRIDASWREPTTAQVFGRR